MPGGMTSFLYTRQVRIFDYPKFAEPFRDRLRENAERMAAEAGIEIEFIRTRDVRKEDRAKELLAKRGEQPGLVCIFSAMEPCSTYKPWHNKQTGKTYLVPRRRQVSALLLLLRGRRTGLMPCAGADLAALPFADLPERAQLAGGPVAQSRDRISNGRQRLHSHRGLAERHKPISDGWEAKRIHERLNELARRCCPIYRDFATGYHWSVNQCEYATDVVFRKQADLQAIYGNLTRTAIHTVKPDNIATFPWAKKLSPQFEGEMGNRFNIRIEGTRIKHTMGPVSLKLYDKFGLILRIETTVNDPTFFRHYREVEHRDGSRGTKWAPMQKSIYSLPALRELLTLPTGAIWSSFRRSKIRAQAETNSTNSHNRWNWRVAVTPASTCSTRRTKICCAPSFAASSTSADLQNKTLRRHLPELNSGQMSRMLRRLRTHGLIKKIGHTYKYYVTRSARKSLPLPSNSGSL